MNNKGFTLIELLVTIAIIGVLAGVVLVAINPATRLAEARDAGYKNDVGQVATAMEAYYVRQTPVLYPADVAALVTAGDLKRAPGNVVIVGGGTGVASAYAPLDADTTAACYAVGTPLAFFCYRTDTGVSAVVCLASGTPSTTCQ